MQLPTEILNKRFYINDETFIISEYNYISKFIGNYKYYYATIDYKEESNSLSFWTMFFGKLVTYNLSIYEIQSAIKAYENNTTQTEI